jgi:hypothetical protein
MNAPQPAPADIRPAPPMISLAGEDPVQSLEDGCR